MNRLQKDYLYLGGIAGLVIILDQITKWVVRTNLALGESWMPVEWLSPYFRFVHWYNTGVALGMFQGAGDILKILVLVIAGFIIYYFPKVPREDWSLRLAMCLQLGGALGNWIDRIILGHVTDFISVSTFPVFNVADSSITIGVAILLFGLWQQERMKGKDGAEKQEPEDHPVDLSQTPTGEKKIVD